MQADWTLDPHTALDMVGDSYKRNNPYHIILLDWKLPGMDGTALSRSRETWKFVPSPGVLSTSMMPPMASAAPPVWG